MTEPKKDSKPTQTDVHNKPEGEKHLDRDGGQRQPTDQSDRK
jgi:hypothetical protein